MSEVHPEVSVISIKVELYKCVSTNDLTKRSGKKTYWTQDWSLRDTLQKSHEF